MLITFCPHLQYVKCGEIFSDLLLNTEKEYNTSHKPRDGQAGAAISL